MSDRQARKKEKTSAINRLRNTTAFNVVIIASTHNLSVRGFGVPFFSGHRIWRQTQRSLPLGVLAYENVRSGDDASELFPQDEEWTDTGDSSKMTEGDLTYQTNLKISKLAEQSSYNSSAAVAAQELLDALEQPDTVGYNGVLKAYAKATDSDSAWMAEQLLAEMERVNEHQVAQNRMWYEKRARGELTNSEVQDGPPPITVNPNVRSYSTVLDAWSRRKDKESAGKAYDLLLRMENMYMETGNEGYRPNDISYNTVIAAWAKSGEGSIAAHKAQELLLAMEDQGIADVISYNAVILAWARSGVPDAGERAEALLRNMTGAVQPNTRTYTTVIDAWSRSAQNSATRAHTILNEMEDLYDKSGDKAVRPNCYSYSAVINAYALSKEPGKATMSCKLLKRMKDLYNSGENLSVKPNLVTYNSVLNACATTTRAVEGDSGIDLKRIVKSIYRELTDESQDLRPDHFTYGTVLKACANLFCGEPDNPDFVKEVFRKCCDDGQVSFGVCYQLKQAAPFELYRSLIPPQAFNTHNGHFSLKDMPSEWRRNVRDHRRSRR